jgi:glycine cleavage system H protein
MQADLPEAVAYRRANFSTRLPVSCLYSPLHFWLARRADGVWRVGFTKFATRMLGEMVDHGFQAVPGNAVQSGQIIGWIEGFKAISDLFSVGGGRFHGGNPDLADQITLVNQDPYGRGWLYEFDGQPDARCVDVQGYQAILDRTIDKLLEKQAPEAEE